MVHEAAKVAAAAPGTSAGTRVSAGEAEQRLAAGSTPCIHYSKAEWGQGQGSQRSLLGMAWAARAGARDSRCGVLRAVQLCAGIQASSALPAQGRRAQRKPALRVATQRPASSFVPAQRSASSAPCQLNHHLSRHPTPHHCSNCGCVWAAVCVR